MSEAAIATSAAVPIPAARAAINPWIVAIAVVVPTFMEVLDTTIANVALHQIAGGLSAAVTDSEWVITSYLAANAIILPISGWISARLGRRNYFLLSIAVFTLSSGLCGVANSLGQLILFRVMQGLAGGGLQPSSQGVLIDNFPPEKQGSAMTLFGVAALLAPIIGPTLGGWLTDNYSWRWIFYINIPVGTVAVLASWLVLEDPDYLKKQRAELKKNPTGFDTIGLCLLSITMVSWEVVLSKGQEWDWFNDPFFRVQTLATLFVLGLGGLIFWESRQRFPVVNFKPLMKPNFAPCCIIIFCAYGMLYGSSTTLPSMLQTLFGYDATHAGLVLSPSGVFAIMMMIIVGALVGRGVDARLLIGAGLVTLSVSNIWMSRMNLDISPWQVVWPRVVLIVGLSMIFAPLNVAAYIYIPRELRGAAVGLLALLRNEGGSVGTSIAQTFQERREQVHLLRLNEHLDPFNPAVADFLAQAKQFFLQATGDPASAKRMALASLDSLRQQQASSLAYFDCFWLFAVLGAGLVFLVFLMKRSVAEKGAHVASE